MDDTKDLELPKTLKQKHSILIVDDEDSILNVFKRILADGDYEIHTASNGLEGLNKLHTAQRPYSLIISDQKIPMMSGVQFFT
jgi:DNA-binding NtrC family response regulator